MSSRISSRSRDELTENRPSSSNVHEKETKRIEIDGRDNIWSVVFLVDGKHVVSGGKEGKIRRWQVEDGKEVGTPMDAGSIVCDIAVSRDGKWVVSGTKSGWVTVWNAENHEKETEFQGHDSWARAVDVSPDAARIATGSEDETACVWSLFTGERLLGPWQHDYWVAAVKFSPSNGRLIATATWGRESIRIYDSQSGHLLVDIPVEVGPSLNKSLVWADNSKQLFTLSRDGKIKCLDVFNGSTLSRWRIHNNSKSKCIALESNGTFIAASTSSSVSFWDTTTHKQIGPVIEHTALLVSMAISANNDIVTGADKIITLRTLYDILPLSYSDNMFRAQIHRMSVEKDNLEATIKSLRAQDERSNEKIVTLEKTVQQLCTELADSQHRANSLIQILRAHEQKNQCEALYAQGRIYDAAGSLLEITNTVSEVVRANKLIMDWLVEFTHRCASTLESIGDEALNVEKHGEALAAYSTALSLSPSTTDTLLIKWASMIVIHGTVNKALSIAAKFKLPRFLIYREICDVLEGIGRVTESIQCFRQMQNELGEDTRMHDERAQWELSFQRRCTEKLEKLADVAMDSQSYSEATEHFSTLLLLDPVDRMDIFIKRSTAQAFLNSWEEALNDADEAIKLDPSSYRGYERMHAALHGARRHAEAVEAFQTMLSKLDDSSDERIRALRDQYIDATPTIRRIVEQTIRHMPRVLIDTTTGHLHDKKQLAEAFEALPIYNELVSMMTTQLDHARIWRVVKKFYQYVMLSHRWEHDEPLLQKVENISIYKLEAFPANMKLQNFCSLVRSLGFRWAWSDTCCVDKLNHVILQESLVAMFTWFRGSSLTIVYLRGVSSESQVPGGLQGSIWNTRAWTYQEYVAAEIVQFYTEDWKPYLDLTLFNHKESPIIVSEMQHVTGVSAQELAVLRPSLDRVREKLYLASTRQTTLVEDIAYSLFGIFNVAIPVIYGEGNRAVGRLLEHILTGSGDVTILAWTGYAGSHNSCLPTDLSVYGQIMPPHIPRLIETAEMDRTVMELRSSLPNLSFVVTLYDQLNKLPSPSLAATRLRLPSIAFRLTELVHTSGPDPVTSLQLYRATTSMLGDVEIKTADDLTGMEDLYLVHPWIRPLLDQEFSDGAAALDRTTQALRFVARLQQPFGGLLFAPLSRVEYRRVAADGFIMVQIREEVSLIELIDNIRTIEVQ